jgi:hypothetical protein
VGVLVIAEQNFFNAELHVSASAAFLCIYRGDHCGATADSRVTFAKQSL